MRKYIEVFVLTFIVFATLTLATAKIETPFDGHDTYGFPFTFFTKFSGMCMPCPPNPTETNYLNLLIDILVSLIFGFIIWIGYKKTKVALRKKKNGI